MNKVVNICIFLVLTVFLAALASSCALAAEDLPFSERYYKDFKEGNKLTVGLFPLDIIDFSYYGQNHSARLLGVDVGLATAMVRVDNKAVEIATGITWHFDIDNITDTDLNITVNMVESKSASLTLSLNKRPAPPSAQPTVSNASNSTNSSATANSTSPSAKQNSTSSAKNSSSSSSAKTVQAPASSAQESQSQNSTSKEQSSSPSGATVININFNISLPPGSGIGFLIILAIVLGGLLVYRKLRNRAERKEKRRYK